MVVVVVVVVERRCGGVVWWEMLVDDGVCCGVYHVYSLGWKKSVIWRRIESIECVEGWDSWRRTKKNYY